MMNRFFRAAPAALTLVIASGCGELSDSRTEPDSQVEMRSSALTTTCKTASTTWANTAFAAQTGTFTITYEVTPNAKPIDSVVGLSRGPQGAFTGFGALTRFNPASNIDARNGGVFQAANVIPYSANVTYRFRLVVNVQAHTYSAYVTPTGGSEKTIGLNYAFRTEQATVNRLDSWGTHATRGSARVCGAEVTTTNVEHTITLRPVADAFVKDGAASTNFGTGEQLEVKAASSAGTNRHGYIKFDLNGFTNVASAKLRLHGRTNTASGQLSINVHAVSSTSWVETAVNWSNKPALGAALGGFTVTDTFDNGDKFYEVDVTSYLQAEKSAGRNLVTLGLKNTTVSSQYNVFYAREKGDGGREIPPGLMIRTTDAPAKAPVLHDAIDPFLSTPAPAASWTLPVVIIRYLPTRDGTTLSPISGAQPVFGANFPLSSLIGRLTDYDRQTKFMLEEGSKFRGYKTAAAKPSLGFKVIDIITIYEELPDGVSLSWKGRRLPGYAEILNRIDARDYVENKGVKQFWIWANHYGHMELNESKMSSPLTGDISNSWLHPDDNPPLCSKTYTIYHYNYARTAAEATHNHGHQQEAELAWAANRQDGDSTLFWSQFVGNTDGAWATGRCGDTHHPVNARSDYDYNNVTDAVMSDIEDWRPQGGGERIAMNASRWDAIPYVWPNGVLPGQKREAQWYTYWRQAIPGRGNVIQDASGRFMTNWWRFVGDWDGAVTSGQGLHAATPAAP